MRETGLPEEAITSIGRALSSAPDVKAIPQMLTMMLQSMMESSTGGHSTGGYPEGPET